MEHREWIREKAEYERTIVELREQRDLETKRVRELDGDLRALRAEIDDVRRVLGASEGETLLAAAERVVEAGEVIRHGDVCKRSDGTWGAPNAFALGTMLLPQFVGCYVRPESETPAELSAPDPGEGWRLLKVGELIQSSDSPFRDGWWARSTKASGATYPGPGGSGLADYYRRRVEAQPSPGTATQPAPMADPSSLDEVITGRTETAAEAKAALAEAEAQLREIRQKREQRAAKRDAEMRALRAEHEETLRRLASAQSEVIRLGAQLDAGAEEYHADEQALFGALEQLDEVRAKLVEHERELDTLRASNRVLTAIRDEGATETQRWRDRALAAEARLDAGVADAMEGLLQAENIAKAYEAEAESLRAKLAEAEERARRAEAETALSRRESATAVEGATRHLVEAQRAATERERSRCAQIAARHGENAIVQEIANPPRLGVEVAGLAAQAPSWEPAPVEASEPEALRVLRTWCALDPGDRRSMIDEVATYVVGGSVAVEVLDAAPEVLRLYDAARAEVAALTALVATESERAAEAEDYLGEVAAMVGSPGIRPSMVPGEVRAFIGTAKPEAGVVEVDHGRWTVKR